MSTSAAADNETNVNYLSKAVSRGNVITKKFVRFRKKMLVHEVEGGVGVKCRQQKAVTYVENIIPFVLRLITLQQFYFSLFFLL